MFSISTQISQVQLHPRRLPSVTIPGLYVHIPFCFHKCHYCDFYSISRQDASRMQRFVDRVLAEADAWTLPGGPRISPTTVFFGGGTPSLLPIVQMQRLIHGLRERFDFSQLTEWTVEVNPATASLEYCAMLRESGVDRISLGAQSFDPVELKTLERHHDPADVSRTLEQARTTGFKRLNIDLIYAIPGQDLPSWQRSLEAAIALGLTHYSCYGLTYEPNTPLAVRKRLGQVVPTAESVEIEMMRYTRRRLAEVGCPAYEISNYAVPDQQCLHNLMYWTGGNYVGLGPSAASHVCGHRWKNQPHLGEWEQTIDSGSLPAAEYEVLTARQRIGERIMLELRLARGVQVEQLLHDTGIDARQLYSDQLTRLAQHGLLAVDAMGFRLTPAGIEVADAVAAEFVAP